MLEVDILDDHHDVILDDDELDLIDFDAIDVQANLSQNDEVDDYDIMECDDEDEVPLHLIVVDDIDVVDDEIDDVLVFDAELMLLDIEDEVDEVDIDDLIDLHMLDEIDANES